MHIEILEEFVELAKTLSFSTTARELHISQSTLSTHIASLEQQTGVTLVERTRPISLTNEGSMFLVYASKICSAYREALDKCKEYQHSWHDVIKVATTGLEFDTYLRYTQLVRQFGREHPHVRLDYVDCSNVTAFQRLLRGEVDFGVMSIIINSDPTEYYAAQGISCLPCFGERVSVWISKDCALYNISDLSLADLAGYQFPLLANSSFDIWDFSVRKGMESAGVAAKIVPYYSKTMEDFVFNAFGKNDVYLAPTSFFNGNPLFHLRDDRVVVDFDESVKCTAWLGVRAGEELSGSLKALCDFFRTAASPGRDATA